MNEKVVIVGAGMAGCFMAYCLAKKGYKVELYEKRPDVRKHPYDSGRSFNLTLYYRGIQAMKKVGVWDAVRNIATIAEGNVAHYHNKIVFDPFDADGNEILYTVHRNHLNGVLLDEIEKLDNVQILFDISCVGIDKTRKKLYIKKQGHSMKLAVDADIIIGADGINSIVREEIQKSEKGVFVQQEEDWGYKEVHISPEMSQQLGLKIKATHTWPRKHVLLIAFPNPDNSFTLMFNLPKEGKRSFAELNTESAIRNYIAYNFPDLVPLLPEIIHSFHKKPTGKFVTIYSAPWFEDDFLVLIGDAAHAVIPFYGQGVCAAFDDCLVLCDLISKYKHDYAHAFLKYQTARKRNTDTLARLSKENFIELRDKSRSMFYIVKDKADTLLHRVFPKKWLPPLYVMIAHGELDYDDAVKLHARQQRKSKRIGLDLAIYLATLPWTRGK